jgi:hypothetical protein
LKDQELFKHESKLVLKIFAEGFANNEMFLDIESIQPSDEVATNLTVCVPSALIIGFVTLVSVEAFPSGNIHLYVKFFPDPTLVALVNTKEFVFSHWLSSLMLKSAVGVGKIVRFIVMTLSQPLKFSMVSE